MTDPIVPNYSQSRFSKDDSALLMIDHRSGVMQLVHDYPWPREANAAWAPPQSYEGLALL